jgi:hypothetical protein
LIFDPQKSGLSEGNYTLAYYKDGQFITKDINITKKSDGTLTAALDGVYPFVIAKKGGVLQKTGAITNPFEQTSFKFAVVALDENGSVVGVGKVEDNNLSLYSTAEPKKYQLVSYILKNNKVDINGTDIEITTDMLNPDYPLYDNMSDDDKELVFGIQYYINNNMNDISLSDFLYPQNVYCSNGILTNTPGQYDITATAILNCCTTSTTLYSVNVYQSPSISISASINPICTSQSTILIVSGGGNGTFRYQLEYESGGIVTGYAYSQTSLTSFTPSGSLGNNNYRLYVQERDEAGNIIRKSRYASTTITAHCPFFSIRIIILHLKIICF